MKAKLRALRLKGGVHAHRLYPTKPIRSGRSFIGPGDATTSSWRNRPEGLRIVREN
jgi:hypothetical protein